jgi:hypothetical protein
MFIVVGGFLVAVILVAVLIILKEREIPLRDEQGNPVKEIPVSEGYLPLLGNLWFLNGWPDQENFLPLISKLIADSGEVQTYRMILPGRVYYITANPDFIKHTTSTKFETIYMKGQQTYKQYLSLFGKGIFNVRQISNPKSNLIG